MKAAYTKLDVNKKQQYSPKIIKYICNTFGYENYPHSFKDKFITWYIWEGKLVVSFDLRQKEHVALLSQCNAGNHIRIPLSSILQIYYPKIMGSKLVRKRKEHGGVGGFISASDDFYSYEWNVSLSDGSIIIYENQKNEMDMTEHDVLYMSIIQERAFVGFLQRLI